MRAASCGRSGSGPRRARARCRPTVSGSLGSRFRPEVGAWPLGNPAAELRVRLGVLRFTRQPVRAVAGAFNRQRARIIRLPGSQMLVAWLVGVLGKISLFVFSARTERSWIAKLVKLEPAPRVPAEGRGALVSSDDDRSKTLAHGANDENSLVGPHDFAQLGAGNSCSHPELAHPTRQEPGDSHDRRGQAQSTDRPDGV